MQSAFVLLCIPANTNEWIVFGTNTQMSLSSQLFKHHLFKLYIVGHVWWMWTLLLCSINTRYTVWITDIKWIIIVIHSICNLIWQYHSLVMMVKWMEDSRTVSNHFAHDTTQLKYTAFPVGLGLPWNIGNICSQLIGDRTLGVHTYCNNVFLF